ncbi:MAG: hypothetical protein ABIT37_12665 [Luteolibacter sp.]
MITRRHLPILITLLCSASFAAGKDATLQIRAVLQDSAKPNAKFFVGKVDSPLLPLKLADEGLTESQKVSTENGDLNLFTSATVDKANPLAGLAATIKIPTGPSRVIVIIVPAAPGTVPPYRMVVIDDDPKSFPWGESKAVNLTPVDLSLEVGDQKLLLPGGGKVTAVPKVTKVDEYNRAPTNFSYKQNDQWVIAAELQLQYVATLRRVFVITDTPDASALQVRSIVDQRPPVSIKSR